MTLGTGVPSADPDSYWHPERVRGLGKVSCGNLDAISSTSGFMTFKSSLYVRWRSGQEIMVISPFFQRRCLSNGMVICSKTSSELKRREKGGFFPISRLLNAKEEQMVKHDLGQR